MKHPLNFTKEDMKRIMNIPVQIGIGPFNKINEITEILEGKIISFSVASNSPLPPGKVDFKTSDGLIINLNIFKIKMIKIIS